MRQMATVISTNGKLAEIEVSRKAMCDGCHNSNCDGGCPMSGLFSSGKTMRANAINKIGAVAGDKVEIETSDKDVLVTALAVFLLPLITGGALYLGASLLKLSQTLVTVIAVIGFLLPFPFLRIAERKAQNKGPKIRVTRILD